MTECIGQQLGNYRLVSLIGAGGFADVYLSEHIHLGTQAAIKVLSTSLGSEGIEQFYRESRTIARLEHPHIIRVLDFGVEEDGTPFLIMSYAPNGTLRQRHPKGSRVPLSSVVTYVKQVASALQYAHDQHVIHRDIKPENLLIGRNHEILLSDFGIALVTQGSSLRAQDMAGTIAYMAPEQIQAHPYLSSDQYSLGVLIYEWLRGERPFHGSFTEIAVKHGLTPPPPLCEKVPMLSPAVEQVVLTALAKDPKQRFVTIQDFAIALEHASRAAEQTSLTTRPIFMSPQPAELSTPVKPMIGPAELLTPPSQPAPKTEVVHLPSSAALSMLAAPVEQPVLTQLSPAQPQPVHRGLSRRAVLIGLAGVSVGAAGAGMVWLTRSQATPQASSTSPTKPAPSPTHRPPSSPTTTAANPINSSGTMFGFDLQHTRFNPMEQTLSAANVSRLVRYWAASTSAAIASSPVVANGLVYIGSNDYNLYAFDATTSIQRWKAHTGNEIHSSPAIAHGVVYIGSNDSILYAFYASSGNPFWKVPTGGPIDSSPTIANGIVYVGSDDYNLYALDATASTQRWTPTSPTRYAINSSPAIANGIVYISTAEAKLYAFDAATGSLTWSASTENTINSSPTVADGIVYIGCNDGYLYAFDAAIGGKARWTAPTGGPIYCSPAVANGTVYIGSDDGKLYAFSATTGKPLWSTLIGTQIRSSPMVANGVVYVGSDDGKLYAFSATTGKPLWSTLIGTQIRSSPMVANGVVYIGSDNGTLYAFHLP